MSGGSMDYLYRRLKDVADELQEKSQTPLRRAFGKHLELVSGALHDIEWVDSCDYGGGDEIEAIEKALGKPSKEMQIEILKDDAKNLILELKKLI
jgi:hypothetical protein